MEEVPYRTHQLFCDNCNKTAFYVINGEWGESINLNDLEPAIEGYEFPVDEKGEIDKSKIEMLCPTCKGNLSFTDFIVAEPMNTQHE